MCDNFPVASVCGSLENAEIAKSWKGVGNDFLETVGT
jgi:hypothetical protein